MIDAAKLRSHREFRWLWLGQSISVAGSQLAGLAFAFVAVRLLKASESQMGMLNAAETAAFLLIGLPAGAWVDRWLKRRVMILADFVRMCATASVPLLWFLDTLKIWHLVAVGLVMGIATVFFDVAYQSYVPILVPEQHIGRANSALETTNQISSIAGPSAVGFLLTFVKAPVLLLADAISYFVSLCSLLVIRDKEIAKPISERQKLVHEIAEGVRFVWNQKLIRRISLTTATSNFFGTGIWTLMPLLVLRDLNLSPASWGIMGSVASVGGLLGAMSASKLMAWIGEGQLVAFSAVVSGTACFTFPIAAGLPANRAVMLLMVGQFLTSFTVLTYNITQVSARQRLCPKPLLGRMNASIRFFVWGVMPLSALTFGAVGGAIGIRNTLVICATGSFAAAGWVVFSPLSRMREMPSRVD